MLVCDVEGLGGGDGSVVRGQNHSTGSLFGCHHCTSEKQEFYQRVHIVDRCLYYTCII